MEAPQLRPYVHEAAILLEEGTDPAAVGAAVTTELCGAAAHDGPCRWPHNNAIDPGEDIAAFLTVFVAPESEEREVRTRIQLALRSSDQWVVKSDRTRPPSPDERALARLLVRPSQQGDPRSA